MDATGHDGQLAWWREPTRDQWLAWVAGWLGWTLDAFYYSINALFATHLQKDLHFTRPRWRSRLP